MDKEDILYLELGKEIKEKRSDEILKKYENDIRLCIQFANPFNCEGIVVNILKEAIKECFGLKCLKKNKHEIKPEINNEFIINYYIAKSKAKDSSNVKFIANGKKWRVKQLG